MSKYMVRFLLCSALVPGVANAQTNPTSSQPNASGSISSGEIIVTAQRFEQRLQDVPISITAVTAEELQARNVTAIGDLQYSIPGFSTYRYGPGQEFYQLQGVSNTLGSSTVGLYLDETPLALDRQGNGLSIQLLDLERVEVLRGPQATLYGESSMGGTIRYIPAVPRLNEFSGSVEAQVSMTEEGDIGYRESTVVNAPIATDKVAVRLVASFERIGGWIDSAATGESDVNGADILTLRGTVLAEPTERLSLSLMGAYQEIDQGYQDFGVDRQTTAAVPTPVDDAYALVQAKLVYDLGFADLTGIGSYIWRDYNVTADLSSFFVPFLPLFGVPAGTVTQVANINSYDYDVYSGELRLASHNEGTLGWSIGATYRQINLDLMSSTATAPGTVPFTIIGLDQTIKSDTYAFYGEVSYDITDKLTAIAGARYYNQDLSQNSISTNFGASAVDLNKGSFDSINPRFNLSYRFNHNSMIYANVAKGFRGGGFNLTSAGGGAVAVPPTFDPDEIWTYEFGTKHQLFDGMLSLDASVYHSKWSDVQSYNFAPGSPVVIVNNSGDVSGWGIDLAAVLRPVEGLTLSGTYGWNNLEFDKATGDKLPGDPVDGAVRESYSGSGEYRFQVTDISALFFRVDYQHAAASQITFRNFGQIIQRPSRDLVNFRMGVDIENLQVSFFANNIFDEDNPNIIGPFGVYAENLEQSPRVIGVNMRLNF